MTLSAISRADPNAPRNAPHRQCPMTTPAPVHVLCPLGDPTSPRVWSGTPRNLVTKLESCGRLGTTEHVQIHPLWYALDVPIRLLLRENRRSRDTTTFIHHVRVAKTARRCRQLKNGHILHIGTNEFPYRHDLGRSRNYLVIDDTWRGWMAGFGRQMPPPPALQEAMDQREKACYEKADHIFTLGRHIREQVIVDYGIEAGKVTAIGTGFGSLQPFTGRKDNSRKKILFVAKSRFEEKGGCHLVDAFRLAHARDPELSLTIAGRDEYMTLFANEPGITPMGYFLPGSDTLQRLFEEHSLFVMPSRHDPWGLVYLESLVCKMPFVSLKRNAFDELSCGGQFGYGLETESPEELAGLLTSVFANPAELEAKGRAGQEYCLSNYTWDKVIQRLLFAMDRYSIP